MRVLWGDVRIFVRGWPRMRLLMASAVCVLALAIGASAVAFNFLDAILLLPSPIRDVDRLVSVWTREAGTPAGRAAATAAGTAADSLADTATPFIESSYPQYLDWRDQGRSVFEDVTTMGSINFAYRLRRGGGAEPVRVQARVVSDSFFATLGATPLIGRTPIAADNVPGVRERAAVLSWGLWRRQFGGDAATLGSSILLNDRAFTIVGIMPRDFQFPAGAELWLPIVPEHSRLAGDRGVGWLETIARLRPGVRVERAREEATAIARRNLPPQARAVRTIDAALVPLPREIFGASRPALAALMGAAALLWLIGCANVGHLLLVRSTMRRRELAVREALGASRGRLVRQQFAEALTLAVCGGAVGTMLAAWMVKALLPFVPIEIPGLHRVGMNGRTLAFAVIATLATTVLIGAVPVFVGFVRRRVNVGVSVSLDLSVGADAARTRGAAGMRRVLMLSQVALAVIVLVGAGLLVRSFVAIKDADLGYAPAGVVKMDVDLSRAGYDALLARVRALPGVAAAGAIYLSPLEHGVIGMDAPFILEGENFDKLMMSKNPTVNWETATPGSFEAMGLPLREGRVFDDRDTASSPAVVIISEGLARYLSREGDGRVLGRKIITLDGPKDAAGKPLWQTVVGVVKDARYRELTRARYDIYLPQTQASAPVKHLIVRATADVAAVGAAAGSAAAASADNALALVAPIREIVRSIDPTVSIDGIVLLEDLVTRARASWIFNALVFTIFGALSLTLVAAGMFGVLAYSVATRTREIGIRLALGAQRHNVLRMLLLESLTITTAGLTVGLAIALSTARLLDALLFGIAARDITTFASAATLVCLVAIVASWIPARAALAISPLVALRHD